MVPSNSRPQRFAQRARRLALTLVLGAGLVGCVSGISRHDDVVEWQYRGQRVRTLAVSLNDTARGQLADNDEFDPRRLQHALHTALDERGLFDPQAPDAYSMVVELTDVRVRSTFWAFLLNVVYGRDRVAGTVTLRAPSGVGMHRFDVRVSNLLAGVATAPSDARTRWMYREFARLTVEEIARAEAGALVVRAPPPATALQDRF